MPSAISPIRAWVSIHLRPPADAGVQAAEIAQHADVGRRQLAQALEGVDAVVGVAEVVGVDRGQLAQQRRPLGLGRGGAQARIGALLERRGQLDPPAAGAVQGLEPGPRVAVVGAHAEDAAVLGLGLARLALALADRRHLEQEIGGRLGGVGVLAERLVEVGQAIPLVVVGGQPVQAGAGLAVAAVGRLAVAPPERARQGIERARDVVGAVLPRVGGAVQPAGLGGGVGGRQRVVGSGQLLPRRLVGADQQLGQGRAAHRGLGLPRRRRRRHARAGRGHRRAARLDARRLGRRRRQLRPGTGHTGQAGQPGQATAGARRRLHHRAGRGQIGDVELHGLVVALGAGRDDRDRALGHRIEAGAGRRRQQLVEVDGLGRVADPEGVVVVLGLDHRRDGHPAAQIGVAQLLGRVAADPAARRRRDRDRHRRAAHREHRPGRRRAVVARLAAAVVDDRRRRLRLGRAIDLAVAPDRPGQPPQVGEGVGILGREQEADQVAAERARQILELLLDHLGAAAQRGQPIGAVGALGQRRLDGDHVAPGPVLLGQPVQAGAQVVAIGGPRERGQQLGRGLLGLAEALVEHARLLLVQLDPAGRGRRAQRDVVAVGELLPQRALIALGGQALGLGQQRAVARRHHQRLEQRGHRARPIRQAALAYRGQLAAGRHVGVDVRRHPAAAGGEQATALVAPHLGQLAPQAVGLGGALELGQRGRVGRLVVGAPPVLETGLVVAELLGGEGGQPGQQALALTHVLGPRQAALEHPRGVLVVAQPLVQIGGGGQRLVVLRIDGQDALVGLQRARGIAEAIAADHADLEGADHLGLRLADQVQLALGDLDGGLVVAAHLVQAAQHGVGVEIGRIELGDQPLELADRVLGRTQPLGQHGRPLARGGGGAGDVVDREHLDVHPQQLGQLAVARRAAIQAGQRVERGAVARGRLAQPLPRLDRPLAVAELAVDDRGVAGEVAGAQRGGGRAGRRRRRGRRIADGVEPLEHAGQFAPPLRPLVQVGDRGEDLLVGGRGLERLLPAIERAGVVAGLGRHPGQPAQHPRSLGRPGRRCRVVLERLLEALLVAGLLEHALHAIERVAVAGQDLEDAAAREHHAVGVGQPGLAHRGQPAQHGQALDPLADRPLAGRGRRLAGGRHVVGEPAGVELELAAQGAGQAGVVALALVQLGQGLERAVVVGRQVEDLLVQRDRAARLDLALAVGLGDPPQRAGPLARRRRGLGLAVEHRDQLLPHLGPRRQPADRLARLGAARLDLLDAAPGVERARHVAEAQLADLGDLLEPADQLGRRRAGVAGVLERELVQVGQAAEVAPLAEVLDVAGERVLVARIERQRLVEQLGGLVLVAEVLAGERGQIEDLDHLRPRIVGEAGQVALDQRGQLRPALVLAQELAQAGRGRAARRLVERQLGERGDQGGPIGALALVEGDLALQQRDPLGLVLGERDALGQDALELLPLAGGAQRLLELGGGDRVERIDADRAAQERQALLGLGPAERGLAEVHVDRAGLAGAGRRILGGLGPGRRRVDLGQRLAGLGQLAVEAQRLLERGGGGGRVAAAQLDLAEREPQLGAAGRRRLVAEHVELGAVQLGDHGVVAERGVERAGGGQRVGALGLEPPRLLPVVERAIDAAEVLVPDLGGQAMAGGSPGHRRLVGLGRPRRRLGGRVGAARQLAELTLEDVAGLGVLAGGEEHLDQARARAIAGRLERHRRAQVALGEGDLAMDGAGLAGLRPDLGGLGRVGLERRPQLAHLGERLALAAVAQRPPQGLEPSLVARVLAEGIDVGDRERRRPGRSVVVALAHAVRPSVTPRWGRWLGRAPHKRGPRSSPQAAWSRPIDADGSPAGAASCLRLPRRTCSGTPRTSQMRPTAAIARRM